MIISIFVFKDCNMMVVVCAHEVGRERFAVFVDSFVECSCYIYAFYGYTFNIDSLLFIEPNGVVVQICESRFCIAAIFFEPLLQNILNTLINYIVYF